MKHLLGILIAVLILSGCREPDVLPVGSGHGQYFPLEKGNIWIYSNFNDPGARFDTLRVAGVRTFGGREYYLVETTDYGYWDTTYYREDIATGRIYIRSWDLNSEALYLDPAAPVGTHWDCGMYLRTGIYDVGKSVAVPAGTFDLTVTASIGNPWSASAAMSRCIFAQNIGPVKGYSLYVGPISGDLQLESAVVGGVHYPH